MIGTNSRSHSWGGFRECHVAKVLKYIQSRREDMKTEKNNNLVDVLVKWVAIAVATLFSFSGIIWLVYILVTGRDD